MCSPAIGLTGSTVSYFASSSALGILVLAGIVHMDLLLRQSWLCLVCLKWTYSGNNSPIWTRGPIVAWPMCMHETDFRALMKQYSERYAIDGHLYVQWRQLLNRISRPVENLSKTML